MTRFVTKTVAACGAAALGVVTACLGSLPEATQCPAAAVHTACRSQSGPPPGGDPGRGGPEPPPPIEAGACTVTTDTCMLQQFGGNCACRAEIECTRTSSSCFPPPDCPASVKNAEANAQCFAVTPAASTATCMCGCASCAGICDGQGPILGANQTLRFEFPANVPRGTSVGVMVRSRGTGKLTLLAAPKEGPGLPIGDITAPSEFSEILAGTGNGQRPGIRPGDRQPVALELQTDSTSSVEIDCVVPYVAP